MIQIDWNPSRRILRNFGLIGLGAFSGLAALIHYDVWIFARFPDSPVLIYILLGLAGYCGVMALAAPAALKWLYIGLTVASFPIGFVFSYIIVGIMFYLVITPIALIFRLIGRDALRRQFEPAVPSYWIPRKPPDSVKRYFRQF